MDEQRGIAWENQPERAKGHYNGIRVFSVGLAQSHDVRLLGPIVGVWVHWVENRSRPCSGEGCRCCEEMAPARWKGYAPAQLVCRNMQTGKPELAAIVLELTEMAAAKLQDVDCHGLLIRVERRGRNRNSPLQIHIAEKQPIDQPPPPFDVKPILMRLWGVMQRPPSPAKPEEKERSVIPFRKHA